MTDAAETCARWLVGFEVDVETSLVLRTGELLKTINQKGEKISEARIELDSQGQPFIPGSALKGVLRNRLSDILDSGPMRVDCVPALRRLFGDMPTERRDGDAAPTGGLLEFKNAYCRSKPELKHRGSTAINRKTGTASRQQLKNVRAVPAGTRFQAEIIADSATDYEIALVLAAVLSSQTEPLSVGSASSAGSGKCSFADEFVSVMDVDDILSWLTGDSADWRSTLREHKIASDRYNEIAATASGFLDGWSQPPTISVQIRLDFESPFLVSEQAKADDPVDLRPVGIASTATLVDPGTKLLPGSSFRGVLRSHAERLLRTLFPAQELETKEDQCLTAIERLFGKTGWRGKLQCSDFQAVREATIATREMVAIDRITGGGMDGAKFAVSVVEAPLTLEGTVTLDLGLRRHSAASGKTRQQDAPVDAAVTRADVGLLALVARDLVEGDLSFGYGRQKGFGACRATIALKGDVTDLAIEELASLFPSSDGDFPTVERWHADDNGFQAAIGEAVNDLRVGLG